MDRVCLCEDVDGLEMSLPNRLKRGIRLFEHPLLDWGSRIHPILPAAFFGPLALALIVWGVWQGAGSWGAAGSFLGGYVLWLLTEYGMHRWLFHWRPKAAWLRRLAYYIHEHHHRYQEWDRLLAPPLMSLTVMFVALPLLTLVLGPVLGIPRLCVLIGGFGVGYLVYDYIHLYIHFARPRTWYGRFLRRCHLEHHFLREDRWYCISCPWLDYLFRTHGGHGPGPRSGDPAESDAPVLPRLVEDYERNRDRDRAG